MKLQHIIFYIFLLPVLLLINNCFPTYQARKVEIDSLQSGTYSDIQAKVFKSDNRVILFPDGYTIVNKSIKGDGIISDTKSFQSEKQFIEFPLDSIIAMTTYEETTSGGRYFGSFLLAFTAPPLTFLGIYCIACPKCCFGSCPTIYTYDGKDYNLEAELFSECISRQLEGDDIDLLKQKFIDNRLKLKITNEALETHYINKFEVVIAEHPIGTELYPTIDNKLILVSKHISPISMVTKEGLNITNLLNQDDNIYYRSSVEKVTELKTGPAFDWIDIKMPSSKINPIKMILKYRNTLLSTTLLYDVVIGSQGEEAIMWTKRMNEDLSYASQFKMIYDAFSGIRIKMFDNGLWKDLGKFKDAGPLNWKYIAAQFPAGVDDTLTIRLEFIPDNFMIDYIAFDTIPFSGVDIKTKTIYPFEITDGNGNQVQPFSEYTLDDDLNYLQTEPGDVYNITYKVTPKDNYEVTALIYSKGYYNEWIRGSWINNKNVDYTFNLYDVYGTLSHLADSWIQNSELLENEFFQSRFSLKEMK